MLAPVSCLAAGASGRWWGRARRHGRRPWLRAATSASDAADHTALCVFHPRRRSEHSLDTDPLVSYIASRLPETSLAHHHRSQHSAGATGSSGARASGGTSGGKVSSSAFAGGGAGAGGGAEGLQQWAVAWEDIHLQRLIGRGSYGKVRGGA